MKVRTVQHDRDRKFSEAFVRALKRKRVVARKNGFRSPNLNAYIERFIQTLRRECLDHFIVLGTKHLDHLCSEFASHYHEDRPHQSLDIEPILGGPQVTESDVIPLRSVRSQQRLGGLLKSYSRKAA